MLNRRMFVRGLSAAAVTGFSPSAEARRLEAIGLQLYTVRRDMEKDFEGTLAQVGKIGFREVELAGLFGHAPSDVRAVLARYGLSAPSMHVDLPQIRKGFSKTLEDANALGVRHVICAWLAPEERRSLEQYKGHAAVFNRAGEEATKAGIQFGFHCHDFEFAPLQDAVPYDLLLKETDPSLVQMEMDLYWITRAGADPLHYFQAYPGRFPLVHVKDMDASPRKFFTEVGKGTIDFKRVFAQSKIAGIRHYFVEQDETPGPAIESARQSFEYLKNLNF
jgi:sugar phosphate isomerase/epimerase